MSAKTESTLQGLRERWEDECVHPAMETIWPEDRSYSLSEASLIFGKRDEHQQIEERLKLLEQQEATKIPPLIGVIGGKNAGKSSWISGFLSDEGRQRILTGERFNEGTQRFVFWLPSELSKDPVFPSFFASLLQSIFQEEAETLPEDGEEAHAVYSRRNSMQRPVIAYDSALNDLGLALLDTPDFQTSIDPSNDEPTAPLRVEWIRRTSKLLQSVVFVVSRSDIGNEVFSVPEGFLLQEMRELPRYLCLNKMRRPEPDLLDDEDVRTAIHRFQPEATLGAYDFAIRNSEQWLPSDPGSRELTEKLVPAFFTLQIKNAEFDSSQRNQTLKELLQELDGSLLADRYKNKLYTQVAEELDQLQTIVRGLQAEHCKQIETARNQLSDQLAYLWPAKGGSQLEKGKSTLSPESTRAIRDSLERTAPSYARPTLWMKKKVTTVKDKLSDMVQRVREPFGGPISFQSSTTPNPTTISVFDLEDLVRHSYNSQPTFGRDPALLKEAWSQVFLTISKKEIVIDINRLDEGTSSLWAGVPLWKKLLLSTTAPALVCGALAAVLTLPIITLGSPVLLQLSISELVVTLFGGGIASEFTGNHLFQEVVKELEDQERRVFVTSAHHVFGLPPPEIYAIDGQTSVNENDFLGNPIHWPNTLIALVHPPVLPK